MDYDPKYEQIILNLLGKTVIAERLPDAIRMSKTSGNRLRIVTLDGQMIHSGGSMTGGSSIRSSGILSRASELEQLKHKLYMTEMERDLLKKVKELERKDFYRK